MSNITKLVESFWAWSECAGRLKGCELSMLSVEPCDFPQLLAVQQESTALINKALSNEEVDAFLMCMAIDNECEYILRECSKYAHNEFLETIISRGITYPQSMTRWQVAELLRRKIPHREHFLSALLADEDPYVRKRAYNVAYEVMHLGQ